MDDAKDRAIGGTRERAVRVARASARTLACVALLVGVIGCGAPIGPGGPGGPTDPTVTGLFPFFADDGVHGSEPWVTDGTEDGTRMLADLVAGPASSWHHGGFGRYFRLGDELVFAASSPDGSEPTLYRSDGTAAGTLPFAPGLQFGHVSAEQFGEVIIFNSETGDPAPSGLYRSDGSAAGTVRLQDRVDGLFTAQRVPSPAWPERDRTYDGALFTAYGGDLVRIDGDGATLLHSFTASCNIADHVGVLGDLILFNASDPFLHPVDASPQEARCELWRYDTVTGAGPDLHRTFAPDANHAAIVRGFAVRDGFLYYVLRVSDTTTPMGGLVTMQLRATDGSPAPTDPAIDDEGDVNLAIDLGTSGFSFWQRAADEPIYGFMRSPETGHEWALVLLEGGVHDASVQVVHALGGSVPVAQSVHWIDDHLVYRRNSTDAALYAVKNGTTTVRILFDDPTAHMHHLQRDRLHDRLYFWLHEPLADVANLDATIDPIVETLWVTDGTVAGTRRLATFCRDPDEGFECALAAP